MGWRRREDRRLARLRILLVVAALALVLSPRSGAQEAYFPFEGGRTLRSMYGSPAAQAPHAVPFFDPLPAGLDAGGGTYRTLCVRLCDGYYFPISHVTNVTGFSIDAGRCAAACGGEARLFYHPNPGGDVAFMLDFTGRTYASYPNAFRYRRTLVAGCQCHPQPWSEAELARHRGYEKAVEEPEFAPNPDFAAAQSPAGRMDRTEAEDYLAWIVGGSFPTRHAHPAPQPVAEPTDLPHWYSDEVSTGRPRSIYQR
jgi:hypothetical protein